MSSSIFKEKVISKFEENPDFDRNEFARELGVSRRTIRRIIAKYKESNGWKKNGRAKVYEGESVNKTETNNSMNLEINSIYIHTLEQALDFANVDLNAWEIERWICNSWTVTMKIDDVPETRTNYQIKVWLKPKVIKPIEKGIELYIEKLPTFKFNRVPQFTKTSGFALEIAQLDAHMGKLAWGEEVGRDYDLNIAVGDYVNSNELLLSWAMPFKPEKIFFIVGQDLMHVENFMGITPKGGNVLDVDTRLPKIAEAAFSTVTKCIYSCRDVAPVEVIWVPGNHDMHASFFLCMALREHFRNDKFVEVDVSPAQRKARLWGKLLVGWTHEITNRHNSWVNELAKAFKNEWAAANYWEWHYGHKHKKMEIKSFPIVTEGGVTLRQLTALSPIDAWHYENLFTDAVPGGEAFVWNKDRGVVANFTAWTETN